MTPSRWLGLLALVALASAGAALWLARSQPVAPAPTLPTPAPPASTPQPAVAAGAFASLQAVGGSGVSGKVTFTEVPQGLKLSIQLPRFARTPHGLHVHEGGDCAAPGGHFNPAGNAHGAANAADAHAGDLGNLKVDAYGKATILGERLALHGPASVVGRTLVVTAQPDDLVSQPDGGSGVPLACGVILAR